MTTKVFALLATWLLYPN